MNTTQPDTELDLSGFLAAHRCMRVEYGRLAVVAAEPRHEAHEALIDDQVAVFLDLLYQHHSGEDDYLWPVLRQRAPEAVAELDMLEAQHEQIEPLIDISGDCTLSRRRRAIALAELNATINRHLDDEERIVLPLIRAHITAAEWEAFSKKAIGKMSAKQRKIAFGSSALESSPEQLSALMAMLPTPARLVLKLLWMPTCRRRNRRLYEAGAR